VRIFYRELYLYGTFISCIKWLIKETKTSQTSIFSVACRVFGARGRKVSLWVLPQFKVIASCNSTVLKNSSCHSANCTVQNTVNFSAKLALNYSCQFLWWYLTVRLCRENASSSWQIVYWFWPSNVSVSFWNSVRHRSNSANHFHRCPEFLSVFVSFVVVGRHVIKSWFEERSCKLVKTIILT